MRSQLYLVHPIFAAVDRSGLDIINRKYELDIRKTHTQPHTQSSVAPSGVTLSAEEEAELAALMSDDE